MVKIEYANAYSEVLEILKYISKEEYEKIPKQLIEVYQKNANKEYYFNYNPRKTLEEQNVSEIAKGIIAILFRDYWATEEQREKIKNYQSNKRNMLEEEKRIEYGFKNLFENKNTVESDNKLVVINDQKWYEKILKMLKKIFNNKI